MAIIHEATLTPTKLELLTQWLPGRAWFPEDSADDLRRVAACRFDDPDGEVGVEILVVRKGDDGPLRFRDSISAARPIVPLKFPSSVNVLAQPSASPESMV